MNLETLRDFCLGLKGVTEDFPFGEETLVFRVEGKIFLLTPVDSETLQFNVKCDPEQAQDLRAQYANVLPGYHMNKKHWNTVLAESSTSDTLLRSWIKDSYDLVVASLPAKTRSELMK